MSARTPDTAPEARPDIQGAVRSTVLAAVLCGLGLSTLASIILGVEPLRSGPTFVVLTAIATGAQFFRTRLRRRGAEESISLFEAALVASVLLLQPALALVVTFVAILISELAQRNAPIKIAFNLGTYLGSASLFVMAYHAVAGADDVLVRETGSLSARVVIALIVAQTAFVIFNSFALYRILSLTSGSSEKQDVLSSLPITLMLLVGNVVLGAAGVLVWLSAPALLPLMAVAAAVALLILREASRSLASESRASQMNSLAALVGRDGTSDPLPAFFSLVRQTFEADQVLAVSESLMGPPTARVFDGVRTFERTASAQEAKFLNLSEDDMNAPRTIGLPSDWSRALLSPFETEGGRRGVLVLGFLKESRAIVGPQDVSLLAALTTAVRISSRSSTLFKRLSAVTASQTEAVVAVSGDGVVSFVNPAAARMLHSSTPALVGRPVRDVLSLRRSGVPLDLGSLIRTRSTAEEVQLVPLDVSGIASPSMVVDCSAAPLDGEEGFVLVLRDVSERLSTRARLAATEEALLRLGRTMQQSLLPPSLPQHPRASLAARYLPAAEGLDVGGDFYDVYPHSEDTWSLVIGDVCGRGPEAAALTALTRYSLRAAAVHTLPPSELLEILNTTILSRNVDDARFCTVAALNVDFAAGKLTASLGGHPPVLIVRSSGEVVELGTTGVALGLIDDPFVSDTTIDLEPGDLVLLYTDGVVEARSEEHDFFEPCLFELLPQLANCSAADAAERLHRELIEFRAPDYSDDTAFLFLSFES